MCVHPPKKWSFSHYLLVSPDLLQLITRLQSCFDVKLQKSLPSLYCVGAGRLIIRLNREFSGEQVLPPLSGAETSCHNPATFFLPPLSWSRAKFKTLFGFFSKCLCLQLHVTLWNLNACVLFSLWFNLGLEYLDKIVQGFVFKKTWMPQPSSTSTI